MIMDVEVAWTLSGKDLYQDPDLHFHLRLVGGIGGARAGAGVSRILALRYEIRGGRLEVTLVLL
uniref:Uncharacterized protein n=1 Tax=Solanum lycopersicum TaxID=4081 RepID=A0A3Q7END2_SOLLC